ncbi:MAG: DUF2231 domain-containing protein [Phycisphaerales bacterium]
MNFFPPIPPWEGLHPIVVHFPIALLMVVPLFVAASLFLDKSRRPIVACTAALLLLGAGSILLATMTGDASEANAKAVPGSEQLLESHEESAELARNVFLGLAGAYVVLVLGPVLLKRDSNRGLRVGISAAYLAAQLVGCVLLARAAHDGGRLVHELGVRAPLGGAGTGSAPLGSPPANQPAAEDDAD